MTITDTVSLKAVQDLGFPMGGEPVAALDLVDTVALLAQPAVDFLDDDAMADGWWELQASRLPAGPVPDKAPVRRLRAALREVLEARLDRRPAEPSAVEDLNFFADSVPSSPRLVRVGEEVEVATRWHPEHGGNVALAAIARGAIELLADPVRGNQLKRCANPTCSMIFVAENSRRVWCTANVCGNRARVARHYQRSRQD